MLNILNSIKKCCNFLFIRDTWSLGYRINKSEILPFDSHSIFTIIKPNLRWWYADPFSIEYNGRYYIFCEMLDSYSGIGSIGVSELLNGQASKVKQVIKEPFHMSYPNVFQHNGVIYMIPETRKDKRIRLYRATDFPYKWELDIVLLDDIEAVDSTILSINNKEYLFTYDVAKNNFNLRIYELDMEKKVINNKNPIILTDNHKNLRPAGNFFRYNNDIIRPSQYNQNAYGERLLFYKLISIADQKYEEMEIDYLSTIKVRTNSNQMFSRIHTINKAEDMEVIDLLSSRFCIYKPFLLYVRILHKIIKG